MTLAKQKIMIILQGETKASVESKFRSPLFKKIINFNFSNEYEYES